MRKIFKEISFKILLSSLNLKKCLKIFETIKFEKSVDKNMRSCNLSEQKIKIIFLDIYTFYYRKFCYSIDLT